MANRNNVPAAHAYDAVKSHIQFNAKLPPAMIAPRMSDTSMNLEVISLICPVSAPEDILDPKKTKMNKKIYAITIMVPMLKRLP